MKGGCQRRQVMNALHMVFKVKVRSYIARYPILADLFIPRPSQLIWETFSHAAIARKLFVHISTTVCIARYSFIQLCELWRRVVIKLAKGSKRPQWDLKSGSIESPAF